MPRLGESLLMSDRSARRRKWRSAAWGAMCGVCAIVVLVPLASILMYVIHKGAPGLSLSFFTSLPKPPGEPGAGMASAFVGTFVLLGIACAVGLPIGILGGVYLAEVGKNRLSSWVRFFAEVLSGAPSITVGVFAYALIVVPMRRFSALAGGVALAILLIPTVARTTEELLRLVPQALREAALALGVPMWRTILFVVFRTGAAGIATGVMLAVARIAGETAPLLFTALGNDLLSTRIDQPIGAASLKIYHYATSPYADWQSQAWTLALVLVFVILVLNVLARVFAARASRLVGGAR